VGSDHTFGKGTVQAVIPLRPGMGALKVTTGMFFIPAGESTQQKGVAADVVLPSIYSTDEIGEKALDYALPPQTVKNFVSEDSNYPKGPQHWIPIEEKVSKTLSDKSQARISKDPKFAEIIKDIAEAKKAREVVKLAEVKKKADEEQAKKKGKKEEKSVAERVREADAPQLNEAINVLVDLIATQQSVVVADHAKEKESASAAQPR